MDGVHSEASAAYGFLLQVGRLAKAVGSQVAQR